MLKTRVDIEERGLEKIKTRKEIDERLIAIRERMQSDTFKKD